MHKNKCLWFCFFCFFYQSGVFFITQEQRRSDS